MDFGLYMLLWKFGFAAFLGVSAYLFIRAGVNAAAYGNRYGAWSAFVSAGIVIFFTIIVIFGEIVNWPFIGALDFWVVFMLVFNILYALKVSKRERRDEKSEAGQNINEKKDSEGKYYVNHLPLKIEYYRKAFHLIGLLILLSYFVVAIPLGNILYEYIYSIGHDSYILIWGSTSLYPYDQNDPKVAAEFTYIALWGAFILVVIPDFIRIFIGHKYSYINNITSTVLRKKEYNAPGPHVYLLLGSIIAYHFAIIGAITYFAAIGIILITCISDGLAAVIGRRFGIHKFSVYNGDTKSIEGLLAGGISAFIIGIIFLGPFYGTMAAVIFILLDYFPLPVADNLLNPIIMAAVTALLHMFIGLPLLSF